jgi:hypothetical protein
MEIFSSDSCGEAEYLEFTYSSIVERLSNAAISFPALFGEAEGAKEPPHFR